MPELVRKNPSYLIKHRKKWQVRLAIPKDVQWAFGNKTIFKRSTGCNVDNIEAAKVERDKVVKKFKSIVELHRSGVSSQKELHRTLGTGFTRRPFPPESIDKQDNEIRPRSFDHQNSPENKNNPRAVAESINFSQSEEVNIKKRQEASNVEGWIRERLLNKSKQGKILRYDFWSQEKKKVDDKR